MAKRSRRSSHRRTKRRSVRSTRSRRHHRARHTRGRGKRMCGGVLGVYDWGRNYLRNLTETNHGMPPQIDYSNVEEETQQDRDAYNQQLEEARLRGS